MNKKPALPHRDSQLIRRLAGSGLRLTAQRLHVYTVLRRDNDHPSAETVFLRAKKKMPEISIATVYNCLDALVKCGLARQVSVERGATRYCSNMEQHNHFHCEKCGATYDVDRGAVIEPALRLPAGFRVNRCEISLRGVCPACSAGDQEAR